MSKIGIKKVIVLGSGALKIGQAGDCLLYTSDAADDNGSV